jgi:mitogen-activated protein kinase 15
MSEEVEKHVLRKYELQARLGRGAYGIVWKAIDRKTGQQVALKKCFDAFQNATDAQRTFREIMLLQEIEHDNIVKILNVLKAENERDIYIVTDLMESDLHAVIKANILEDVHKRFVIYQLLKALKYIHSGAVLHRDLKPSNILINSDCRASLADWGLSRSLSSTNTAAGNAMMTDYVATRFYRCPEILLGSSTYSYGVDMWAVGCILAEMILGKPLFPGTSTMNQLERILEVTGRPLSEDLHAIKSTYAKTMLDSVNLPMRTKNLRDLLPTAPSDAIDFIRACLVFNPTRRLTAERALRHPYVAQFQNPADEPVCKYPIRIPLDDNVKLTVNDYKYRLYDEIIKRKRDGRIAANENSAVPPVQVIPEPVTASTVAARPGVSQRTPTYGSNLTSSYAAKPQPAAHPAYSASKPVTTYGTKPTSTASYGGSVYRSALASSNPIAPSTGPGLYGGPGKAAYGVGTPSTTSHSRPPSGGYLRPPAAVGYGSAGVRGASGTRGAVGSRPTSGMGNRPTGTTPATSSLSNSALYYSTANSSYGSRLFRKE